MKPQELAAEDYELSDTSSPRGQDVEPLLPRYERHEGSSSRTTITPLRSPSERRRARFRHAVSCLCLCLLIIVPSFGFMGCWFGKQTIDKVKTWDQLPPDWKEWLEQYAPNKGADHVNFPTECVDTPKSHGLALAHSQYWFRGTHTDRFRVRDISRGTYAPLEARILTPPEPHC